MDIGISTTFFDSVKKIINRERWYWKIWDLFRYDFPAFFLNCWNFRKVLWRHRNWDYRYSLETFKASLEIIEKDFHNSNEIEISKNKKIEKMKRVIWLLDQIIEDSFIELAEAELGSIILKDWEFEPFDENSKSFKLKDNESPEEKEHNSKVYKRSNEIEKEMWKELWTILEGQDYSKFIISKDSSGISWEDQYDGSGIKTWWK